MQGPPKEGKVLVLVTQSRRSVSVPSSAEREGKVVHSGGATLNFDRARASARSRELRLPRGCARCARAIVEYLRLVI